MEYFNNNRTIRNLSFHLLDYLINKKIIIKVVTMQKSGVGFRMTNSKIIGIAENAEEMIYSHSWNYYL